MEVENVNERINVNLIKWTWYSAVFVVSRRAVCSFGSIAVCLHMQSEVKLIEKLKLCPEIYFVRCPRIVNSVVVKDVPEIIWIIKI